MNRATPRTYDFAERLAAYEAGRNESSGTTLPAALHVCEKLRPQLATMMGKGGFNALLRRALALASAEVPSLRTMQITADGSWEEEESEAQIDSEKIAAGSLVLVAHLLGLLAAFIGENLTLRLVLEVWPKVPVSDLAFGKGDNDAKEK